MPAQTPVLLTTQGDKFINPTQILSLIWEGSTTAGDTVELRDPKTQEIFWPGRTNDINTYLGVTFSGQGLHAPNGFYLSIIDSGRVFIYIQEVRD